MYLADVSVRRPVFAAMMIAALVVFGLISYPRIGVDLFPNVDFPVITATVVYPGADPETMEDKVAEPIEEAVQSVSGIDALTSVSQESVTQVIIQFELEVPVDQALAEIRDKVSAVERDLPSGADPPLVQKFDIGAAPILNVTVAADDLDPARLTEIADDQVKAAIEQIPGVGGVDLIGGREREIKLLVQPDRLAGYSLTVDDVAQAVGAQSLDMPAGYSRQGAQELTVKTRGEVRNVSEIESLIIPSAPGTVVRISDVAEVVDGIEDARSASSLNGRAAIALVVRKQSGSNTVEVAERVRELVAELSPELEAEGVVLSVPTDNSVYIEHAIGDLQFDLLLGAALTVLIIFVFLGDGRATLISALALPTSVVGTFLVMAVMDFSFNNMTMLAMSLSIGILVDDAIVVIENIYRHLEMGKTKAQAALEATSEIGLAVLATTLSIVAVFVPVAVMEGIIGRFFFQFGITVAVAVLLSMFVSFSLTPLLSSRILKGTHGKKGPMSRLVDWIMRGLSNGYARVLGWSLRHPALTLLAATGAFVGAVGLLTQMKSEFIPPEDRAQFAVIIETPTGTSLGATEAVTEAVSDDIRENLPGVEYTFTTVGDAQGSLVNRSRIEVLLTGSKTRPFSQQDAMAWVRTRFEGEDEAKITVEEISAVGGGGGAQSQAPIQFVLRGNDLDELENAASEISAELKKTDGLVDVDTNSAGGKPEISIEIDRDRAADLGVPVATVATTIRSLVAGDPVGELRSPGGTADITIAMPEHLRSRIEDLPNIEVRSTTGQLVDLANIVRVERGEGPSVITRLDRQRQVTVLANLDGLAMGDAQKIVSDVADKHKSPGINTKFVGMVEIMEESFGHMILALGLAVVLVYMILAAQFNSFVQPIAIMLSLPLSFVGAFGALYLAGMTLNIFSMIGLIMLMGIVTKNAILLVDFTNARRELGHPVDESLVEAGRIRLRPILMTTAATVFGMLPVAMAISEGGETRAPMAMAVIGGLITSTLLTLLVVPVVYLLFDKIASSRLVRFVTRISGLSASEGEVPVPVHPGPAPSGPTDVTQPADPSPPAEAKPDAPASETEG